MEDDNSETSEQQRIIEEIMGAGLGGNPSALGVGGVNSPMGLVGGGVGTPLHWLQLYQPSMESFEDFLAVQEQGNSLAIMSADSRSASNDLGGDDKCACSSCRDHSVLVQEIADEMQKMREYWSILKQEIKTVYRLVLDGSWTGTGSNPDLEKMRTSVHVLTNRDPHQLFNRLETLVRSIVLDIRDQLYNLLTKESKNPHLAQEFIVHLLEAHNSIVEAARILAPVLHDLEVHHLRRFSLTWELFNKHMYQKLVYSDSVFQNNIPIFISQLRAQNPLSRQQEERVTELVRGYLDFDVEMENVAVFWSGSKALLREYTKEQERLKERRQSLKSDYHRFREEQRKGFNSSDNLGFVDDRIIEADSESPLSLLLSLEQLGPDSLPEEISSVLSALPDLSLNSLKEDEAYSSFGDFGALTFDREYSPSTPGSTPSMPIGLSPAEEMAFSTIINHFISEGWDLESDEEFEDDGGDSYNEDKYRGDTKKKCLSPPSQSSRSQSKVGGDTKSLSTPSPTPSPRDPNPPSQIGRKQSLPNDKSSSNKSLVHDSGGNQEKKKLPDLKALQEANAQKVSDFLKNLRGKKPEDNNNEDDIKQSNMAGKCLEGLGNDALVMRGDDLATQRKSNASLKVASSIVQRSNSARATSQLNKPIRPTDLSLGPNSAARPTDLNIGPISTGANRPTSLTTGPISAEMPTSLNTGPIPAVRPANLGLEPSTKEYKITKSQSADHLLPKVSKAGCENKSNPKNDDLPCTCRYCQVFGAGGGSVSPGSASPQTPSRTIASRNSDIRDRLRSRLDKKKRSSTTKLSAVGEQLAAVGEQLVATESGQELPVKDQEQLDTCTADSGTGTDLPAKVAKGNPPNKSNQPLVCQEDDVSKSKEPSTLYKKDVEKILEFIEGKALCKKEIVNEKKRMKKERQKLQRLEEQEQLRILERKKSADNLAGKVSSEKLAGTLLPGDMKGDNIKDPKLAEKIQEDIESIFAPKRSSDLIEKMDEIDRELEEFKEFCFNSVPQPNRTKIVLDMKDLMAFKRKN